MWRRGGGRFESYRVGILGGFSFLFLIGLSFFFLIIIAGLFLFISNIKI